MIKISITMKFQLIYHYLHIVYIHNKQLSNFQLKFYNY